MKKKTICLRVKSKISIGIKTISETTQDASYESFRYKIKGKENCLQEVIGRKNRHHMYVIKRGCIIQNQYDRVYKICFLVG